MIRLKIKLPLFNLLSKLAFTALFLVFMPYFIQRINLRQVDEELIEKREQVISLIEKIGIEPFITSDSTFTFGSYNILKDEFISLERVDLKEDVNYIEVTKRLIEGETIDYRVLNYSLQIDGEMYLLEVGKSLASIMQTGENTKKVMLVFLIFIIAITFLVDFQYTRRTLRPLDKITGKLRLVSDPSIFDKRPVKTTTTDFKKLDTVLIELMEHIDKLFRKEKEITVNISHELLTPVSVLRSKLENILLRNEVDPEIAAKVEESLKTLHRLQSLVNSLLLIARIESRQYLREDSFSLKEVVKDICEELQPIAEDSGIRLINNVDIDLFFREANRSLIFSMLYNVVNNAVKHASSGGEVNVKSIFQDKNYSIIVSDSGKGLSSDQINNLFSRFRMRDKSSGDGTGIGLAIAKTIADFHDIEVSVTSEIQKGTTFSFIFPKNS
jgi:signal transduction histidine kinase